MEHRADQPVSLLRLSESDNVAIATRALDVGQSVTLLDQPLLIRERIPAGHKIALRPIRSGEKILKWGCPIGSATCDIEPGELVHTHNVRSDYLPTLTMET